MLCSLRRVPYTLLEREFRYLRGTVVNSADAEISSNTTAKTMKNSRRTPAQTSIWSAANQVLFLFDSNGFIYCNQSAVKLFEVRSASQLYTLTPADLFPMRQPDGQLSVDILQAQLDASLDGAAVAWRCTCITRDGNLFHAEAGLSAVSISGSPVSLLSLRSCIR